MAQEKERNKETKKGRKEGRVQINGKVAKSSSDVKVGDILKLTFGEKVVEYRVTEVKEHVMKDEAKELYEAL